MCIRDRHIKIVSSMGAGAKSDISQVRFADIWDTYHCGLSKAVRKMCIRDRNHTQSYSNNEYRNGHYYETNMHQGNKYIFGEYRGKIDKLNYRRGVAMTRFYYNQSGKDKSTESYSFNPSIVLHYAMSDNSYHDVSGMNPLLVPHR